MKTIVTVVGARPQFIKVAPVSRAFQRSELINDIVVHTGQHFDENMSGVFFSELGLAKPSYVLDVSGGGHGEMTGSMLQKLEPLLEKLKPDAVLVYGDTNTTLAGALAAAKLHLPVLHIEAGLRSFNRRMPEEINRVVTDHLSQLLFSTTRQSTANLLHEGIGSDKIHEVGDVMFDASLLFAERARSESSILTEHQLESGKYVLATIHRAENTDDPDNLRMLIEALERVAVDVPVIIPLHPRTRKVLASANKNFTAVKAIDPVGYLDITSLISHAAVIATDSGGLQKEAFFHEVPCVVLREETEWTELVDLGWNRLAPPSNGGIAEAILSSVGSRGEIAHPYGDGHASQKITDVILKDL
jgi:UDP-GlcNAc3NAcA epimerase